MTRSTRLEAMTSQIGPSLHSADRAADQARERTGNGTDLTRVLVALGVLAFLASFDRADEPTQSAATQPARTGLAASPP